MRASLDFVSHAGQSGSWMITLLRLAYGRELPRTPSHRQMPRGTVMGYPKPPAMSFLVNFAHARKQS